MVNQCAERQMFGSKVTNNIDLYVICSILVALKHKTVLKLWVYSLFNQRFMIKNIHHICDKYITRTYLLESITYHAQ